MSDKPSQQHISRQVPWMRNRGTLADRVRLRMELRPPQAEEPRQQTLFGIPIIYQEVMGMPDMPKDNIPDEVLKKVAGTSKCADDKPQDDCCEEDDD